MFKDVSPISQVLLQWVLYEPKRPVWWTDLKVQRFQLSSRQLMLFSLMTVCSLIKLRKLFTFSVIGNHRKFRHGNISHYLWYTYIFKNKSLDRILSKKNTRENKVAHVFLEDYSSYKCLTLFAGLRTALVDFPIWN